MASSARWPTRLRRASTGPLLAMAVALASGQVAAGPPPLADAGPDLARLPLFFIENRGQLDRRVAYYIQGRDTAVYFTPEGLTFALTGPAADQGPVPVTIRRAALRPGADMSGTGSPGPRWTLKLEFVGANPGVTPVGEDETGAVVSYFHGPRQRWQTGLATFGRVVYRNLWPGIDLAYTGSVNRMKYTFLVHPGADPGRIRLAWRGADSVRRAQSGELEVATPAGALRDDRPSAYQLLAGQSADVPVEYSVRRATGRSGVEYGFRVGRYDRRQPLWIDPAVLIYCGYIGGAGADGGFGFGIAVDDVGNAYVSGSTNSTELSYPVTVGPDLSYNGGNYDAIVAKVTPDGSALVYLGYIGGADYEVGHSMAVDSAGAAYLTGQTVSDETTFPVTIGPDLTHNGPGTVDAFVAKIDPTGTALEYCGYIGGDSSEEGYAIAVDSAGNAYATGITSSTEATFPVRVGPDLTYNGGGDTWVAKVNPSGSALDWCGYVGGAAGDWGFGIKVDDSDNVYFAGFTQSSEATFPVTVGPDLSFNGGNDAFVGKLEPGGSRLLYLGYVGGANDDQAMALAIDLAGNAYITGGTTSTEVTFPALVGPDLTYNGGPREGYVARVNPAGTGLVYAGYIGGAGDDWPHAIAVDSGGNAYLAGETSSNQLSFPVVDGPDLSFNGGKDAFVARVNALGTALDCAGYIGGAGDEVIHGIAVDGGRRVYVAGMTASDQATFPVIIGPDLSYNGGTTDAFVARLDKLPDTCAAAMAPLALLQGVKAGADAAFVWAAYPGALAYDLWYVTAKQDIGLARLGSSPPATPVAGCAPPGAPATSNRCIDPGAVPRDRPTCFFYQVRVFCDFATEGP